MAARLTVRDLLDLREKRRFAMLCVATLEEAEAARRAGVERLSVGVLAFRDWLDRVTAGR